MIPHKNRIPTKAGRVNLTPIAGETNKYTLTRADEPLEEGTPLNKEMLDEFLAASGVTTGEATALELAQDGYVLGDGYAIRFKLNVDINDGYGTTLNINKTGAKRLKATGSYPFGTIKAGTWINAIYDASEDAYIMPGSAEIANYPTEEISADDFIPFFNTTENKNAKVVLAELLKLATKATGLKKELARFTASGTWTCPADVTEIDAWLVGGGGGGGLFNGGGGGGGYCLMSRKIKVNPGESYSIIIGAGGARQTDGGNTTAFGKTAEGGKAGGTYSSSSGNITIAYGGDGGSGGGAGGSAYRGGSLGGPGEGTKDTPGGKGSRSRITTAYANGERGTINPYDGIDYAGGGGGGGGGIGGGFCGGAPGDYSTSYIGGWPGSNDKQSGGGGGYYGGGGGGCDRQTMTAAYYGQGMSGIVIIYA